MYSNKILMIIIAIILISIILNAEGLCKTSSSNEYRGTIEKCYCECNGAYKLGFKATTCTWFPYGQFSSGGCTYCDSERGKRTLKSIRSDSTSSGPFLVQQCSCRVGVSGHYSLVTLTTSL